MFNVRLAELNICIDNKYSYIEDMCRDYVTELPVDFTISATDEEIKAEATDDGYSLEYLETLAIYRKIANKIVEHDGFLMHGVVMSVDNTGIALCAKSGTGKTTHSRLWQQLLGDRCRVINGDKPLVRIKDDKVYAYGTPWAGKEGINENSVVELKKVCFIQRGEENQFIPCEKKDALAHFMSQVFIPENGMLTLKTMDMIDKVIRKTDVCILKCNMDISAAQTAYNGMNL